MKQESKLQIKLSKHPTHLLAVNTSNIKTTVYTQSESYCEYAKKNTIIMYVQLFIHIVLK